MKAEIAWAPQRGRRSQGERTELRGQVRALQRDLQHKEKALAETAALLVLSKKAAAIRVLPLVLSRQGR